MPRVLVVDDEEVYRRQLDIALVSTGHEVHTAASGREAIDIGTRFRPDVLLTDWMLKDDIHGLHVAHVLQTVLPDIRAILMTGFLSDHLRNETGKVRLADVIEKPFTLDRICSAVAEACQKTDSIPRAPQLALFEIDGGGTIRFANGRARELLAETSAGDNAKNLSDVFTPETLPKLDVAIDRWVPAVIQADEHRRWYVRSQEPLQNGSRLLVCRPHEEPRQWGLATIGMLLNSRDYQQCRWPLDGRALVLDSQASSRNWYVSMLESVGAGCYAVVNPEEALHLLCGDEGIEVLLVHCDNVGREFANSVEMVRTIRPDIVIVATDHADRSEECRRLGIHHFLMEPWRIDNLIDALAGRIGSCVECGVPLPLRRPRPGEPPAIWSCVHCGKTYAAVFDDESAADIIPNARLSDAN